MLDFNVRSFDYLVHHSDKVGRHSNHPLSGPQPGIIHNVAPDTAVHGDAYVAKQILMCLERSAVLCDIIEWDANPVKVCDIGDPCYACCRDFRFDPGKGISQPCSSGALQTIRPLE